MRRNVVKLIIFFGDLALLYVSLGLMLSVRYGLPSLVEEYADHLIPLTIVFVVWVTVFYVMDLYNISVPFNHAYYLYAMMVNVGLAVLFFYTFPGLEVSPKTNLALIAFIFTVLFYT